MERFFIVCCDGCNKKIIDLKGNRVLTAEAVYVCDPCRKVWCQGCHIGGLCPKCTAPVERYESILRLLRHVINWDTMKWQYFPNKEEEVKHILVVDTVSHFTDDAEAKCKRCGRTVYPRPHSKKLAEEKGMDILCIPCAKKKAEEGGEYDVAITEQAAREVLKCFEGREDWKRSYV